MNDLPDQKFNLGSLMVDVFSKYMIVVPIKSKSEGDVASALIEGFNKMGRRKCKLLYTDDEGALNTNYKSIQDYLKEHNIEHHRTRGQAQLSDRAMRSFKDQLNTKGRSRCKRKEKPTFNGRIAYLIFYVHITTKH